MNWLRYIGYSSIGVSLLTLCVLAGNQILFPSPPPSNDSTDLNYPTQPSKSNQVNVAIASSSLVSTSTPSTTETSLNISSDVSLPNTPPALPNETLIPNTTPVTTMPSPTTPVPASALTLMAWLYPSEPGCNASVEYRDGRQIDILKPEFFTINGGGSLQLITAGEASCNGYSPNFVTELKQYSKQQFVTISSASTEDMDIFLARALASDTDIKTLVDFVVNNNLTGIELDFEDFGGWSAQSYTNYKTFVTRLGTALQAKGKQLMLDGPAIADNTEQAWFLWRYEDFVNLPVDTIVVMLYDYQFDHGTGQPIAPLDWMKQVILRTTTKFPASRLSIGIPSYGYEGIVGKRPFIRTYDQLKNKPGFTTASRDTRSGERTWKNGTTIYFYQDSESLRQKIAVVEASGVRSVSIWHLGGNQWF